MTSCRALLAMFVVPLSAFHTTDPRDLVYNKTATQGHGGTHEQSIWAPQKGEKVQTKHYGGWVHCDGQGRPRSITQICGSGENQDCGDGAVGWIVCGDEFDPDEEKPTVTKVQENPHDMVNCEDGYVITALCFSGKDPNCQRSGSSDVRMIITCTSVKGGTGLAKYDLCPSDSDGGHDFVSEPARPGFALASYCNGGKEQDCTCEDNSGSRKIQLHNAGWQRQVNPPSTDDQYCESSCPDAWMPVVAAGEGQFNEFRRGWGNTAMCRAPNEGNTGTCNAVSLFGGTSAAQRRKWATVCGVRWSVCGVSAPCYACGTADRSNLLDAAGYKDESWLASREASFEISATLTGDADQLGGAPGQNYCCAFCQHGDKSSKVVDGNALRCVGWVYYPDSRACYLKYRAKPDDLKLVSFDTKAPMSPFAGKISSTSCDSPLFAQTHLLMAHDSASGLIPAQAGIGPIPLPFPNPVAAASRVQQLSPSRQLNCGVRALDLRVSGGGCGDHGLGCEQETRKGITNYLVRFHHGKVPIDSSLGETLDEVTAWAKAHPTELVVVMLSHAERPGSDNSKAVGRYLEGAIKRGIRVLGTGGPDSLGDCKAVIKLSQADAMAMARLNSGGMVIAFTGDGGCFDDNWPGDSSEANMENDHWHQWVLGSYVSDSLSKRTAAIAQGKQRPWSLQMFGQAPTDFMARCFLKPLGCDREVHFNKKVTQKALSGAFSQGNMIEINDVCGYAYDLATALHHTVTGADITQCNADCKGEFRSDFCKGGLPFTCDSW